MSENKKKSRPKTRERMSRNFGGYFLRVFMEHHIQKHFTSFFSLDFLKFSCPLWLKKILTHIFFSREISGPPPNQRVHSPILIPLQHQHQ